MDGKGGIIMCKLKGRMDKGGHYDGNERVDAKGGHYHVQIKRVEWISEGIMMLK